MFQKKIIENLTRFSKFIDEELIKWGWPEDVWFHVDKHSSAHVYLRLQQVIKQVLRYILNKSKFVIIFRGKQLTIFQVQYWRMQHN